jgi:addiction module HigA family antidote
LETLTKRWTQGKTPGQVIDETRKDLAWEIAHLTQALGIQEWDTYRLLNGEMPIDFEMADRLANAFQTTAQFWICLQSNHDACTRRIDSEGRDVTDFPGLWDESDRFEVSPKLLNKKLIAALAGMCYDGLSINGVMEPTSDFDRDALNLLRDIGVVVQMAEDDYEFAPGFDPELGEWV